MKLLSFIFCLTLLAFINSTIFGIPSNGEYTILSNSETLIHRITLGDTLTYSRCQEKEKIQLITRSKSFNISTEDNCSFEIKPNTLKSIVLEIAVNDNLEKLLKLKVEIVESERLRGALFKSNESTQRRFNLEDDLQNDSVVYIKKGYEVLAILETYSEGLPNEMLIDNSEEIEGLELVADYNLPVDYYSFTWNYFVATKKGKIDISINNGHSKLLVKVF